MTPSAKPKCATSEPRLLTLVVVFLLLSACCSIPRFGQRENEHAPEVSDSDLYLEMSRVFTGDAKEFTAQYVAWQPHHYNRPLLPFLAGYLGKYVLNGNLRAAFSWINIAAATFIATLLLQFICDQQPDWRLPWLPSVLFLTGFPQLNWGYHILTDTVGYATSFGTAYYAKWLLESVQHSISRKRMFWPTHLTLLFLCSALAFLARETAWLAVISTVWLCLQRRVSTDPSLIKLGLILLALILGKLPHSIYAQVYHVTGVPLKSSIEALFNWRYVLDFTVKTGVCFNVTWLVAIWVFCRHRCVSLPPPLIVGWTIGSILYIGAGYYVNKIHLIGYPLRMSYALFPLIFFCAGVFFEKGVSESKRRATAVGFCLFQYGINLLGVFLDPGQMGVKATDVLTSVKHFLFH